MQPTKGCSHSTASAMRDRPVGIRHDADFKAHAGGVLDAADKLGIVQEGLATFEVDAADAGLLRLLQNACEPIDIQHADLARTAPQEAVVTFEGTAMRQHNVQAR